jgi:GxxExxY protein
VKGDRIRNRSSPQSCAGFTRIDISSVLGLRVVARSHSVPDGAATARSLQRDLLDCGYRIDLLVSGDVIVEIKSAETLLPIHEAQILTYMRLAKIPLGLLINFNVTKLQNGITPRSVVFRALRVLRGSN